MRVLHTSDWHLGRTLYGKKRTAEFEAFLNWLLSVIREQQVDALIVAGDVFDTAVPGNTAARLYYRFLCGVSSSDCRHVVIVGGNHDSPSFLDAPGGVLQALRVYVVGAVTGDLSDEVLVLTDHDRAALIVCAVPFLRERDLRCLCPGEGLDEKKQRLLEGISGHYRDVCALAAAKRAELGSDVPILATGHLFVSGCLASDDDGVRELYVGTLAQVSAGSFPACIDYLALGHLHAPQRVGASETMRYSGSPLPMSFEEAAQKKVVVLVDFAEGPLGTERAAPTITLLPVPTFQRLESVRGEMAALETRLAELTASGGSVWAEAIYDGTVPLPDLKERVAKLTDGSAVEILRIKNSELLRGILSGTEGETLDDLREADVFERCLDSCKVPEDERAELRNTYAEAVASLDDRDDVEQERN